MQFGQVLTNNPPHNGRVEIRVGVNDDVAKADEMGCIVDVTKFFVEAFLHLAERFTRDLEVPLAEAPEITIRRVRPLIHLSRHAEDIARGFDDIAEQCSNATSGQRAAPGKR